MRISLIGPVYPYRGGIAHFTTSLYNKMVEKGHEVQIISFYKLYPAWLYPGESDKDPSQDPFKVDASFVLDPYNPITWEATVKKVSLFNPEIVTIQWWVTILAPAYAYITSRLKSMGYKTIYIIHNVLPHEKRFWDSYFARLALRQGAHFIVQTGKEKDRFTQLLPGREAIIVPHPIYDIFTKPRISKIEARNNLAIVGLLPVILFFGIIRPYKGLVYLLDAIANLKKTGIDVQLIIAGECWEDISTYNSQIKNLGIEDRVRHDNHYITNEDVGTYFLAADLFAAPYIGGTQSGAVRIALDFGLPIIIGEEIADRDLTEKFPDLVTVVNPKNINQLSEALKIALTQIPSNGQNRQKLPSPYINDGWSSLVETIQKLVYSYID
jgi:D-inositol-3-phosphate glycosyltransferase